MSKSEKKMIIDQVESAVNHSYAGNYDNNQYKKHAAMQSMDANR